MTIAPAESTDSADHSVNLARVREQLTIALGSSGGRYTALPYLFIGSGLSRRYLDLPDWKGLLRRFADEIGVDFDYHLATASGDLPATAESIAHEFHEKWWTDPRFSDQVEKHRGSFSTREGALKAAISEYISLSDRLDDTTPASTVPELAAEVQLLKRVVVDGILTTNYDSLTDQLFPDYRAYVGQDGLLFSDAQFIGETYKIHGSASSPQSLVLTTADYDAFEDRNPYLAAKLLTIFAEHPVMFVGYNLGDEYLGRILESIAKAAGPDRVKQLGERIFFLEWDPDESSTPTMGPSVIQRGDITLPITWIRTHSLAWVWQALARLDRPFPAKVLRQLKDHVKELILNPDPDQEIETVRAIPIDGEEGGEYRVVFGVGAFTEPQIHQLEALSERTLNIQDLMEDTLRVRRPTLDPAWVLKHGIPGHIRPTKTQYVPVLNFLYRDGRVAPDGSVDYSGLNFIIQTLAEREISVLDSIVQRYENKAKGEYATPSELMKADIRLYTKLEYLPLIGKASAENLEDMRQTLALLIREGHEELNGYNSTNLRRAVCQYDRLAIAQELSRRNDGPDLP